MCFIVKLQQIDLNFFSISLSKSGIVFYNMSFIQLVKKCNKLKDVRMANCKKIRDSSVVKLLQNCPNLESLDVSSSELINDKCFHKLIFATHAHIRIKHLAVNNCSKVIRKLSRYIELHEYKINFLFENKMDKQITDDTLEVLSHSSTAESLQTLDIRNCSSQMTIKGILKKRIYKG